MVDAINSRAFDIFVSYARRDHPRVMPIVEAFTAAGLSVFWDQLITPGEAWESALSRGIASARAVIVFWSMASAQSDFVRHEASYAAIENKVLFIRIDAEAQIPSIFATYHFFDFTNGGDQSSFESLFVALAKHGVKLSIAAPAQQIEALPAQSTGTKNRGYAFISHVEEDIPIVSKISEFLKTRSYAYWTYHESDRDYQKPTVLEIEERMTDCALMLTVISPDWKRSEWTQRELAFAREIRKPLFHLRFRNPGPTLAIAGDTYFDFERGEDDAFRKLGLELDKKGL